MEECKPGRLRNLARRIVDRDRFPTGPGAGEFEFVRTSGRVRLELQKHKIVRYLTIPSSRHTIMTTTQTQVQTGKLTLRGEDVPEWKKQLDTEGKLIHMLEIAAF